jgi:hypothetical protein
MIQNTGVKKEKKIPIKGLMWFRNIRIKILTKSTIVAPISQHTVLLLKCNIGEARKEYFLLRKK